MASLCRDFLLLPWSLLAPVQLSTFAQAIQAAGLQAVLSDSRQPLTVPAPTNDAWAQGTSSLGLTLDGLLQSTNVLRDVVNYHVITGEALTAADLAAAGRLIPREGDTLFVAGSSDGSGGLTLVGVGSNARCARWTWGCMAGPECLR